MRVLINGAGIAGPALALFLARTGARITVLEKSQTLLPYGQNVDLQGSARTVMQKLGLMGEVKRFNTTEKGTKLVDSNGKIFAKFPLTEGSSASPTSQCEILRADLATIFYEATKKHPNIEYVFGTTVEQVISNDDQSVKVELSNGKTQTFELLVAADGQWSKVRRQVFPAENVKAIDTGMYCVYFTIPRTPEDDDWWNVYPALRSRIVTLRPDPQGTTRAMFTRATRTSTETEAWEKATKGDRKIQEELIRQEYADAGWQSQRLLEKMSQAPDFYFQKIQQIKMSKWSKSRIICLGDAAFAPSPLTGMGTSLAIDGAYILAGELSKLDEGEHPSRAFEAYESAFRPFVETMQKIPMLLPGMVHPESAWQQKLLQGSMKMISQILTIPWILARLGDSSNEDDYALPQYPKFDAAISK